MPGRSRRRPKRVAGHQGSYQDRRWRVAVLGRAAHVGGMGHAVIPQPHQRGNLEAVVGGAPAAGDHRSWLMRGLLWNGVCLVRRGCGRVLLA